MQKKNQALTYEDSYCNAGEHSAVSLYCRRCRPLAMHVRANESSSGKFPETSVTCKYLHLALRVDNSNFTPNSTLRSPWPSRPISNSYFGSNPHLYQGDVLDITQPPDQFYGRPLPAITSLSSRDSHLLSGALSTQGLSDETY